MKSKKKHFPASLSHLPEIMSWVRSHIEKTSLDDAKKKQVELALEEAIVNVINHAQTDQEISLTYTHNSQRQIEFILMDAGRPFNPLMHQTEPAENAPLSERSPGGLGLVFMKKYMDGLFYRREDNLNILTLVKHL